MIKLAEINFTIEQIAKSDTVLVTAVRELFRYDLGGKRTDESDGYRYTVVAPANKFTEFNIKTPTATVTQEQLDAAKDGVVKAKVKGFSGRFYRTKTGDYAFTATAEALEPLQG